MVTLHTIVRNEGRFIRSALLSALSSKNVTRALVWDTGSTDRTVKEILSISDKRIEFSQRGLVDRAELVTLRNEQMQLTKTPWFLLVDGDEIWPEKNLDLLCSTMKQCNHETMAIVCRTRNVVDDITHYLPESEGHYQIGPWRGHLNIRAIKNVAGLIVRGNYPNEWYELDGMKVQDYPECIKDGPSTPSTGLRTSSLRTVLKRCLKFIDVWYLHTTHLKRSDDWMSELSTIDRLKKHKWFWRLRGVKLLTMTRAELPEMLRQDRELR